MFQAEDTAGAKARWLGCACVAEGKQGGRLEQGGWRCARGAEEARAYGSRGL